MTDPSPKPCRRRFRFSLRHLMLLVLVMSVVPRWTVHEAKQQGIAVRADEPAKQSVRGASEEERDEYRRFSGKWKLISAAFSTAGPMNYTFDDRTLTVEAGVFRTTPPLYAKVPNLPITWTTVRYRYQLDLTRTPKHLILVPLNEKKEKEESRIYEFRDGNLWICPDNGPTPKDRRALLPDKDGDGWLVGLGRPLPK